MEAACSNWKDSFLQLEFFENNFFLDLHEYDYVNTS